MKKKLTFTQCFGSKNNIELDPDPGFWPNMDPYPVPDPDPDPDPGFCFQFGKKKLKIILEKTNFLYKSTGIFFKNKMSHKEISSQFNH